MLRKVMCLLIIMGSLLSCAPQAVRADNIVIQDIKGSFAEKSIIELTQRGVLQGVSENQFAPNSPISRLDFTLLLAKVLGIQPLINTSINYSDLNPQALETAYVAAMTELKIISGSPDNTFNPTQFIKRQDAALILRRALGSSDETTTMKTKFKDEANISSYAWPGVAWVVNNGYMSGSAGNFYPQQTLTRAEAAVIADRVIKIRDSQSQDTLLPASSPLQIKQGEPLEIKPEARQFPLPFAQVYGIDRPGFIFKEGKLLADQTAKNSILTVNSGSSYYQNPIAVAASEDSGQDTPAFNRLNYSYQVRVQTPDSYFQTQEQQKFYPGPDSLIASDSWTGFYRQQGRDIIIDLGSLQTVSKVALEFKQDARSGIYLPKYLEGSISADGTSWYRLGRVEHSVSAADTAIQTANLSLNFPSVDTRYIRLRFPVEVMVFCRHLTVESSGEEKNTVILACEPADPRTSGSYLQDPSFKDILLIFTGDKTFPKTLKAEDFLPLVAYVDKSGAPTKGTMFDTLIFVPYTGIKCTKDSWEAYLDDLFAEGQQLHALDETMSQLHKREKVILTLPYPDSKQSDFGALTPKADSLSFSSTTISEEEAARNRYQAINWYYTSLMERWIKAGFSYLDLAGFYWYNETMSPTVPGDTALVKEVSQLVRHDGRKFFWIPYYGASGISDWQSYGFSHVFIQPNYYSAQNPPADRINQTASLAKTYGLGIELEADQKILTEPYHRQRFYQQLDLALAQGLSGNVPTAYYLGFARTVGSLAADSSPEVRKVYDDLYRWINGTYKAAAVK